MTKKWKRRKQEKKAAAQSTSAIQKTSQSSDEFQADADKPESDAAIVEDATGSGSKSDEPAENSIIEISDNEEDESRTLTVENIDVPYNSPSKKRRPQDKKILSSQSDDEFQDSAGVGHDRGFRSTKREPQRSRSTSRKSKEPELKESSTPEANLLETPSNDVSTIQKEERTSMKYQNTGKVQGQYFSSKGQSRGPRKMQNREENANVNVNRRGGRKENFNKPENSRCYYNSQSGRSSGRNYSPSHTAVSNSMSSENASGTWELDDAENVSLSPGQGRTKITQTPREVLSYVKENHAAKERENEEFNRFEKNWHVMSFKKIIEKTCDLFCLPEDYSLGHCVAADFEMGAGIALQFRRIFHGVEDLVAQNQQPGGLAVLKRGKRFVYYLVTKHISTRKPARSVHMWNSLQNMKRHIIANDVKKLALPRIGCGLDGMNWNYVKTMLEYIFQEVDVELCVCTLKQKHDKNPRPKQSKLENYCFKLEHSNQPAPNSWEDKQAARSKWEEEQAAPSNWVEEQAAPSNWEEEQAAPRSWEEEQAARSSWVEEQATPSSWVEEQATPSSWVEEQATPSSWEEEQAAPNSWKEQAAARSVGEHDPTVNVVETSSLNFPKNENFAENTSFNAPEDYWNMNEGDEVSNIVIDTCQPANSVKNKVPRKYRENVSPNVTSRNLPQDSSNSKRIESGERKRSTSGPRHNEPRGRNSSEMQKTWDPKRNIAVNSRREKSSSRQRHDADFDKFELIMRSDSDFTYTRVKEIQADLFSMSEEYALGHCVAEDMNMGSGIAVHFRQQFKSVDELLDQRQTQGGLAVLDIEKRYIYYLVTKKKSSGKPTSLTFWRSLQKMKKHVSENKVQKIALPRIGCGLDGLEWSYVKKMLEYVFKDVDVEITICNFQQETDSVHSMQPPPNKKCKVVNDPRVITELEEWSIIIYLGSEDGYVTDEIRSLDKKFNIESAYTRGKRTVGETIRTDKKNYILYGFIVRKKPQDPFGFTHFQKCLRFVRKSNAKDKYSYIGIQAFKDNNDELIMSKLVNLMRNTLSQCEVYICWPPELHWCMPKIAY